MAHVEARHRRRLSPHCCSGAAALPRSIPAQTIVELESPIAHAPPLQGLLRRPVGAGPFPAVVLLHSCNGNWKKLDERWGRQIAPWGYVTLTVDSFGPRGIHNTCGNGSPAEMAFDAYRALDFLVRQHAVDPDRVAVLGFSQGGWLALSSVERGVVEHSSSNKFRAAAAFYPTCRAVRGNLTVPALIMVGELDDWTPAEDCRQLAKGGDDYGVSRQARGCADQADRLSRRIPCLRLAGAEDAERIVRTSSRI